VTSKPSFFILRAEAMPPKPLPMTAICLFKVN
jgi:hypothetical protein